MNLKKYFLKQLFLHLDGVVMGPTLIALKQFGIYDALLSNKELSLDDLLQKYPVKSGYLNVALRCLSSQGWIACVNKLDRKNVTFKLTEKGHFASEFIDLYIRFTDYVYSNISKDGYMDLSNSSQENYNLPSLCDLIDDSIKKINSFSEEQGMSDTLDIISNQLNGIIIAPLILTLKLKIFTQKNSIEINEKLDKNISLKTWKLLEKIKWVDRISDQWTDLGRIAFEHALYYGIAYSYFPTFANLPQLLGRKKITGKDFFTNSALHENHIERNLNIIASGEAHKKYFQEANQFFIDIFNKEPISAQPKFIADMGCGDATWLEQLYNLITSSTKRKDFLKEYPLIMIGADYNIKAQEKAKERLRNSNIPFMILFGDIGNPTLLKEELERKNINIEDGLHIRAFIDHNRLYNPPTPSATIHQSFLSTGAFSDSKGNMIPNNYVEHNLIEHFKNWAIYIKKHGLFLLEAHNVDPTIIAQNLGRTTATAFDTYHGYSNQYPVDFDAFIKCVNEAGLEENKRYQNLYPKNRNFVVISANHLKPIRSA